jgi:hypothetical protein
MAKFSLIGNKADRVLGMTAAAVAATTGVGLLDAPQASADIIWSGMVNIPVPDNIDGVYLNVITGQTGSSGGAVPGWDINPYSAVAGNFNLWSATTTESWFNVGGTYPVSFGTMIDPAGTYTRPGGGTNVGTQVTLNSPNLFGFRFTNEGNSQVHYGWAEITFGANAGTRTITQYAYESNPGVGIGAGAIPEPGSFTALALGALGLFGRRRRAA